MKYKARNKKYEKNMKKLNYCVWKISMKKKHEKSMKYRTKIMIYEKPDIKNKYAVWNKYEA